MAFFFPTSSTGGVLQEASKEQAANEDNGSFLSDFINFGKEVVTLAGDAQQVFDPISQQNLANQQQQEAAAASANKDNTSTTVLKFAGLGLLAVTGIGLIVWIVKS
jgi:wobble nucleotide-excising tRNase